MTKEFKAKNETLGPWLLYSQIQFQRDISSGQWQEYRFYSRKFYMWVTQSGNSYNLQGQSKKTGLKEGWEDSSPT